MLIESFSPESKQAMVDSVPFWWHSIELGDGITTPGHNHLYSEQLVGRKIASYLGDKSVLDIGCWDGKYAFQAESQGATKVVGIDNGQQVEFVKSRYKTTINPFLGSATAGRILSSKVEFGEADLLDYAATTTDRFDVTLFLGVLYHQQNPQGALQALSKITRETTVIESAVMLNPLRRRGYKYIPDDELNKDPTNWYVPAVGTLLEWVQEAGFRRVQYLGRHTLGTRAMVVATK